MSETEIHCDFCGKASDETWRTVKGDNGAICDECVDICVDILAEEKAKESTQEAADD